MSKSRARYFVKPRDLSGRFRASKVSVAATVAAALLAAGCGGQQVRRERQAQAEPFCRSPSEAVASGAEATNTPFRPPMVLATGESPDTLVLGDFDGDGDPDLASANASGTVTLLLCSEGFFERGPDLPAGKGPAFAAAGDVNGDGQTDIVVVNPGESDMSISPGANDVVVLLANGGGEFQRVSRPAGVSPQALVLADFDEDGKLDVATADVAEHVSVFRGRGDGTFAGPVSWPTGASFSSGLAAADLDGDGHLDLATANSLVGQGRSDGTLSVLRGRGDGTFGEPEVYDAGGPQPITVVVADLNEDGSPDLATPNGAPASEVSVLLGRGGGAFSPAVKYETGDLPHSLVAADLDDDGHVDLATGNLGEPPISGAGVSVLLGRGDGTFAPKIDVAGAGRYPWVAAAYDIDGDGALDLAVVDETSVKVLRYRSGRTSLKR